MLPRRFVPLGILHPTMPVDERVSKTFLYLALLLSSILSVQILVQRRTSDRFKNNSFYWLKFEVRLRTFVIFFYLAPRNLKSVEQKEGKQRNSLSPSSVSDLPNGAYSDDDLTLVSV